MPILVFAHHRVHDFGTRLVRTVKAASAGAEVELKTTADVFNALSQPLSHNKYPMVVLVIDNHTLLDHFVRHRQFLEGHRVLLVLPDGDMKTVSKAHRLFPRFITYMDSAFKEIPIITEKWLAVSRKQTDPPGKEHGNERHVAAPEGCR